MKRVKVFFRAEGDKSIGFGHVYRCLALAEILKPIYECIFLTHNKEYSNLYQQISSVCQIIFLPQSSGLAGEIIDLQSILSLEDILVLDGYDFDEAYQTETAQLVKKIVLIDDTASGYYDVDLLINHGGEFLRDNYRTKRGCKLLLGFPYLILRRAFLDAAKITRNVYDSKTVFICFGGADPFDLTQRMIKIAACCEFIKQIIVVVKPGYEIDPSVQELLQDKKKYLSIHKNIDDVTMVSLLNSASIAICPSSTIAMEACSVKIGLITGAYVNNQNAILEQLVRNNCADSVGDFTMAGDEDISTVLEKYSSVDYIMKQIGNQSLVVDGLSDKRIVDNFQCLLQ